MFGLTKVAKVINLKLNERKDAHNKIYTEESIKQWIEDYAAVYGVSFSAVGRDLLISGILASGVKFTRNGIPIERPDVA